MERSHAVDHGGYALAVFVLPLLLSSLLESGVSLVTHVVAREKVLRVSQRVLALALAVCALAPHPWVLALGLSVAGAASGAACAAAEAALVLRNPTTLDRTMARWMVAGGVGDVLAPCLVALCLALGGTYRFAFWVVLIWVGAQAFIGGRTFDAAPSSDDEAETVSVWKALSESVRNRRLWLWLAGMALCTLLDELVAALAALRLRNEIGVSDAHAAIALMGYSSGVVVGALLTERWVSRLGFRRILIASSVLCAIALASTVVASSALWMGVSLTVLGFTAAAHYPLLLARAYAAAKGREATVAALAEVFVVFDLILPWVLGELADRHGLRVALMCLWLQPLGVLTLALYVPTRVARNLDVED